MSDNVKVALIVAVTLVICLCVWLYFSPFHTCLRAGDFNAGYCARAAAGGPS